MDKEGAANSRHVRFVRFPVRRTRALTKTKEREWKDIFVFFKTQKGHMEAVNEDVVYVVETENLECANEVSWLVRLRLSSLTREVLMQLPDCAYSCRKLSDSALLFPLVGILDLPSASWRKFDDGWTAEAFVHSAQAVLLVNGKEKRGGLWNVADLSPLTCSMTEGDLYAEFAHNCIESNMSSQLFTSQWSKATRPMLQAEGGTLMLRTWTLSRELNHLACLMTKERKIRLVQEMLLHTVIADADGCPHTWCGVYAVPFDRHSGRCQRFVVACGFEDLATWWHHPNESEAVSLHDNTRLLSFGAHKQVAVYDLAEKTLGPWLSFKDAEKNH